MAKNKNSPTECASTVATSSSNFASFIYARSLLYGDKVCHQMDERSFHFGIRKYPLCARCTGIYVGLFAGLATGWFYTLPWSFALLFVLMMSIDGLVQLKTNYESNNFKRIVTGLLFGLAVVSLVSEIIQRIF